MRTRHKNTEQLRLAERLKAWRLQRMIATSSTGECRSPSTENRFVRLA